MLRRWDKDIQQWNSWTISQMTWSSRSEMVRSIATRIEDRLSTIDRRAELQATTLSNFHMCRLPLLIRRHDGSDSSKFAFIVGL